MMFPFLVVPTQNKRSTVRKTARISSIEIESFKILIAYRDIFLVMTSENQLSNEEQSLEDADLPEDEDVCPEEFIDEDEDEFDFIESSWENGVETGVTITWPPPSLDASENNAHPSAHRKLHLCTKLESTEIAPLFDGVQWAGTRVWKAAVVALEYLLKHHSDEGSSASSLLELGCGLGVPAMLWHLIQENDANSSEESTNKEQRVLPPRVVLTDMPDLLPQLESNLRKNFQDYYGKSIEAKALSWSTEGLHELLDREEEEARRHCNKDSSLISPVFDICLNCDCIYEPLYGRDAWEALADVLAAMAERSPSTLLVTSVERRRCDGVEDFLERLTSSGKVQPIERVLRNEEDKHHVIEIYITRGKEQ